MRAFVLFSKYAALFLLRREKNVALEVLGGSQRDFLATRFYEVLYAHQSNLYGGSCRQDALTGGVLKWVPSFKRGLVFWRYPWPVRCQLAKGLVPGCVFENVVFDEDRFEGNYDTTKEAMKNEDDKIRGYLADDVLTKVQWKHFGLHTPEGGSDLVELNDLDFFNHSSQEDPSWVWETNAEYPPRPGDVLISPLWMIPKLDGSCRMVTDSSVNGRNSQSPRLPCHFPNAEFAIRHFLSLEHQYVSEADLRDCFHQIPSSVFSRWQILIWSWLWGLLLYLVLSMGHTNSVHYCLRLGY